MKYKLRGCICFTICLMMLIVQPNSTYIASAGSSRHANVDGVSYEVRVSYNSDESIALVTVYNCYSQSIADRAFRGAFSSFIFRDRVSAGEFYNSAYNFYERTESRTTSYGYLMFYERIF